MEALIYVFAALFGLVIGSFLNVVIYRLPRGQSLVKPRSRCTSCGEEIRWYDNVPVLSWIALRAKCRACGEGISVRYPMVEALTGGSFALAAWRFGVEWELLLAWFVVAVLISLALIDLDHMIIPHAITLPGIVIGMGAAIALHPSDWWVFLASGAGAALFCFVLAVAWPGGGMGGGDVTMAMFLGGVLGFPAVLVAFFLAFLLGSVVGVYIIIILKKSRKTKVPFGPFLSVGGFVALFFGEAIANGYLDLFR